MIYQEGGVGNDMNKKVDLHSSGEAGGFKAQLLSNLPETLRIRPDQASFSR